MATRTSVLTPLQAAIAARLEGDAQLAGELASVLGAVPAIPAIFSLGTVPKDQPTSFIELGDVSEVSWRTFNRAGNRNQQTLVIVGPREEGIPKIGKIFAHVMRLLESTPLVVAGHTVALARVELVTVFNDPNGTDVRGVVRFTAESLNG